MRAIVIVCLVAVMAILAAVLWDVAGWPALAFVPSLIAVIMVGSALIVGARADARAENPATDGDS
jgi:hypothetical protein